MADMYIGKIPGYNDNITGGVNYEDNLLNGITTVTMRPTAYVININMLESKQSGNDLFKFGSSTKALGSGTSDAMSLWYRILGANASLINGYVADTLRILATSDSTISESIENRFVENFYAKFVNNNGSGSSAFAQLKQMASGVKQMSTGMDSMKGPQMLDALTSGVSPLDIISASLFGIKIDLPKTWEDTSYNSSMSLMVKLMSPSGHPDDIKQYIEIPLYYILLAASPVTNNGLSYGFPPLWEIHASGLMYLKLGAITNITMTRGGNDTSFNVYNQPLHIDVRLTLAPINNAFASPIQTGLEGRYDALMTTPHDVKRSLDKNDPVYQEFADPSVGYKSTDLNGGGGYTQL